MTWEREVEELRKREELALLMGGEEKVARQRARGKLTVRQRIDMLLDKNTFHEIGKISGRTEYDDNGNLMAYMPANFIFGRGQVEGRTIVVAGDDFTVRGGAADAAISGKQIMAEQMANELHLPLVRVIDGTGGGGSVKTLDSKYARTYVPANPAWNFVIDNLATVPVASLALGPVAGLGAARIVSSHYSVMVKGLSQLFVAGPPLVAHLGVEIDKEGLGGSRIHARNGSVDDEASSEEEAIQKVRQWLSYLPPSVYELPPRGPITDDPNRREESLIDIIPRDNRQVYKMRNIIESVVDKDSFMELGKLSGRPLITGLARLDGWPVALMAGDPYHFGGCWNADACHKVIRFVDFAETFHLPVVYLVDNPGFLIGVQAEKEGTIRHGARAMAAIYQATVPWCSILVRKVFGVAGAAHMNHTRLHYRYAWPSGDWGSLPIEGGIEAAYKSQLEKSENPEALLAEIKGRLNAVRSPFRTADAFIVEEIIDPRDTRRLLCEFSNLAAPLRKTGQTRFGLRP